MKKNGSGQRAKTFTQTQATDICMGEEEKKRKQEEEQKKETRSGPSTHLIGPCGHLSRPAYSGTPLLPTGGIIIIYDTIPMWAGGVKRIGSPYDP